MRAYAHVYGDMCEREHVRVCVRVYVGMPMNVSFANERAGLGAAEPDAGKGKFVFSSRAAALVGMATSSALQSGAKASGRGGAGAGAGAGAPRGIRGMFLKIGVP